MADDEIDIYRPVMDLCAALGLDLHDVTHIVLEPTVATATVLRRNESGKLYRDESTDKAAAETRIYRVRTHG